MSTLSVGPLPTSCALSVSVTQATTQEYFVTVLVMLQTNSGVLFFFFLFSCRSAASGSNLLKKSARITNLSHASMDQLLALLVLHVGGVVYAALPMILESTDDNKWADF